MDNTTADLSWTSNESGNVIKVRTNVGSPAYTLTVDATGFSGIGSPASSGPITITTSDQTLITGVGLTYGACSLAYSASASVADGTASTDAHTITYTVTTP